MELRPGDAVLVSFCPGEMREAQSHSINRSRSLGSAARFHSISRWSRSSLRTCCAFVGRSGVALHQLAEDKVRAVIDIEPAAGFVVIGSASSGSVIQREGSRYMAAHEQQRTLEAPFERVRRSAEPGPAGHETRVALRRSRCVRHAVLRNRRIAASVLTNTASRPSA